MANAPDSSDKIQNEAIDFSQSVSEQLLSQIAGAINAALNNAQKGVLGTIEISLLDESTFRLQKGDDQPFTAAATEWVLCDGRIVTGSAYATQFAPKFSVPNMQAAFFRMKDNGAGIDSAGDSATDTIRKQKIKSHTHGVASIDKDSAAAISGQDVDDAPDNLGVGPAFLNGSSFGASSILGAVSNTEGRPRNITVNFFMKIN